MSKIVDKLYDYNTELTNDDRAEIADYIESLLTGIEGCQNMMMGIKFDINININSDFKEALQDRIDELQEIKG